MLPCLFSSQFVIAFLAPFDEFVFAMAKKNNKRRFNQRKKQAAGVLLFLLAALVLVSLLSHDCLDDQRISGQVDSQLNPFEIPYRNQAGMLGAYLSFFFTLLVGWLSYFIPLGLLVISLKLFSPQGVVTRFKPNVLIVFVMALLATMIYNIHLVAFPHLVGDSGTSGGLFTEKLTVGAVKLAGEVGSYILLSGIELILLILYTSVTPIITREFRLPGATAFAHVYKSLIKAVRSFFSFSWLGSLLERRKEADETVEGFHEVLTEEIELPKAGAGETKKSASSEQAVTGKGKRRAVIVKSPEPLQIRSMEYTYPTLDLLKENPRFGEAVSSEEYNFTARMLKETLDTFGVSIEGEIEKFPGPIITRYEFRPGPGVKVNQIVNLSDDLALALKAKRIRIIAPIPGKAAVGVEIPNRQAQIVYLRDILTSNEFTRSDSRLPLALGKTTSGRPYVVDLTKLPHLLIAGATGSGKSVCLNTLITSLLYRLHPHQVRFILIDPKMLELTVYRSIPHLGRPVVTKPRRAEKVLADVVVEMESRYRKLAEASVRNIEDYNKKQKEPEKQLSYIVICVDELADLLMSSTSSRTELLITRLAQMARAVGIHLVLATQRPSVDVITGLIKANFPARIAFQVSSKVDSRTIIDANGAEKLLGQGDMLFLYPGQPEPIRIHGAYVSNDETDAIVKFIKDQGLEMFALENISQASGETAGTEVDFGDPLFREACEVVVRHKQGSVSLLQRRLGIGYQRAARLIDKLEQAGIVSPFDGSKAREVMVDKAYLDALFSTPGAIPTSKTRQN